MRNLPNFAERDRWRMLQRCCPSPRFAAVCSFLAALLVAELVIGGFGGGRLVAADFARSPELPGRSRSPVVGRRFAVSSTQPAATRIAIDVLQNGGRAADAAIASAAALSVLEPMLGGPGGDVSVLYWDAKAEQLYGLEATGGVPAKLVDALIPPTVAGDAESSEAEPTAPGPRVIGETGPLTWTVPGAVGGWFALHERFGSQPWEDLLQPAVKLANDGFLVSPGTAIEWATHAGKLSGPGAEALLPDGKAPSAGTLFKNPDLARTLTAIAKGGRATFYEGEVGQTLVAFGTGVGAALGLDDLASFQATWVKPLSTPYRESSVSALPGAAVGVAGLETLAMLGAYDLRGMGRDSEQYWHLLIEAKRLAVEDAQAAEPKAPAVRLSPEHTGTRRRTIDPNQVLEATAGVTKDTSCRGSSVIVVDNAGNACVVVQDLGAVFGSGVVPGASGFVMQGRVLAKQTAIPFRTRSHSRVPLVLTRDGGPSGFAVIAAGGATPEVLAQVVNSVVDFGSDPQSTLDAARLMNVANEKPAGRIIVEPGVSDELAAALTKRGHAVERISQDPTIGVAVAGEVLLVLRDARGDSAVGPVLSAGSDPRLDASTDVR